MEADDALKRAKGPALACGENTAPLKASWPARVPAARLFFAFVFSLFSGEGFGTNSVGTHRADARAGLAADVADASALFGWSLTCRILFGLGRGDC
jgi:hypothetical protein